MNPRQQRALAKFVIELGKAIGDLGDELLQAAPGEVEQLPEPSQEQVDHLRDAAHEAAEHRAKRAKPPTAHLVERNKALGEATTKRVRDWIADQGQAFTLAELAAGSEVSKHTARERIAWALKKGIVQETEGRRSETGLGRRAREFVYVQPDPSKDPTHAPTDKNGHRQAPPVTGTGRKARVTSSAEMRELLAKLPTDWIVRREKAGHIKIRDRAGSLVATLPSSPSDHRSMANARAQLRRAGAAV